MSLTVTDDFGVTDSTSQSITVTGPPAASFTVSSLTVIEGEVVQFTNTSVDDGTIVLFEWDFDNDTIIDSTDPNPTNTYLTAGTFQPSLTVTDDTGAQDTASQSIVVTERPNASFTCLNDGATVRLTVKLPSVR